MILTFSTFEKSPKGLQRPGSKGEPFGRCGAKLFIYPLFYFCFIFVLFLFYFCFIFVLFLFLAPPFLKVEKVDIM